MTNEHFPTIQQVQFDGSGSARSLSFRQYNPSEIIGGRSMRDHLRFAACYWHTMRNGLSDPFGIGTAQMPWEDGSESIDNAKRRADAFFEFLKKCQIVFWCFHDRDLAPEGNTIAESEKNLDALVAHVSALQQQSGVQLISTPPRPKITNTQHCLLPAIIRRYFKLPASSLFGFGKNVFS